MIIEKGYHNSLRVTSNIYFDDNFIFCGRPYLYLLAYKEDLFTPYSIGIALRDQDDYDLGVTYRPEKENFTKVLHELINWQRDLEQGVISLYDFLHSKDDFFPDCECEKVRW